MHTQRIPLVGISPSWRPDARLAVALARAGADTSVRDKAGQTGRDMAQAAGHTAVLERLAALKRP